METEKGIPCLHGSSRITPEHCSDQTSNPTRIKNLLCKVSVQEL
jgi:hypothetical protein